MVAVADPKVTGIFTADPLPLSAIISPALVPGRGQLFGKTAGGRIELHYLDEAGDETQITDTGELNPAAISLAITDLTDVGSKTGGGTTVVFNVSPVLTTPTIADFTNSTHDHSSGAAGGLLSIADLSDVSGKTGSGSTVVFNGGPTLIGAILTADLDFTLGAAATIGTTDAQDFIVQTSGSPVGRWVSGGGFIVGGASALTGAEEMLIRTDHNGVTSLLIYNDGTGNLARASLDFATNSASGSVICTDDEFAPTNGMEADSFHIMAGSNSSALIFITRTATSPVKFKMGSAETTTFEISANGFWDFTPPTLNTATRPAIDLDFGARGNIASTSEVIQFHIDMTSAYSVVGGTSAKQRIMFIEPPVIDSTLAGGVVTEAATVAISGPPTSGSGNLTITNPYTFWVESGMTCLDGPLKAALKSGANQGAAGAAVGELWHDTDDDTVKMGV